MKLTGCRMQSRPRKNPLNWVRRCMRGSHGGGVRDHGAHDGRGDRDVHGDHDVYCVHGARDDHGVHGVHASSQYPLIKCGFSCVCDGSDVHVVCEACDDDGDDDDDALSLACDGDDGWLSPSCGGCGV